MNCSLTFSTILRKLFNKSGEGNPFAGFLNMEPDNKLDLISNIADNILAEVKPEDVNAASAYDFEAVRLQLLNKSKKYVGLTEDVINNIISTMKTKLKSTDEKFECNPKIGDVKAPLFNFDEMSKLTFGVESMENFVSAELQAGVFKCSFLSTDSEGYEPFVVTNLALNKNIVTYKNELWDYVNNAALKLGIVSEVKPLYNDTVLNQEVFTSGLYAKALEGLHKYVSDSMKSSDGAETIRIFTEHGYSASQAYLKGLILANFDNLLLNNHSDKVSVNLDSINTFNIPTNGEPKYSLEFKWSKSIKIDNSEAASDIEHHSSSLVKMLSDIIPYYEVTKRGNREVWVKNKNGLTVGKSNLDSIGAVLNGLPGDFAFNITSADGSKRPYTIGKAFKAYDDGKVTFKQILEGLIAESGQDNDLESRKPVLESLKRFLYGDKGIHNNFVIWSKNNPNFADFVTNPEVALINHIRNTVKNVYREEPIESTGKTVDVLNLNTTVGSDFFELASNLSKAWKNKEVMDKDINDIKSVDDFFEFISDPKKGGITLSERVKEKYRELGVNFQDEKVRKQLSKLFARKNNGLVATIDEEATLKHVELTDDDLVDNWRSTEFNDFLKLIDLFKLKHTAEKYSILTQIRKFDDSSMPTMGIANLASLYNMSLAAAPQDNFFIKNPGFLGGMETLLEVSNGKTSLPIPDLNNKEAFKLAFTRHFLMSGMYEGKYLIQPWDFSDKPKIFALSVDSNYKLDGSTDNLMNLSPEAIKDVLFNRQQDYYNKQITYMFADFTKLDPEHFGKLKATKPTEKAEAIDKYLAKLGSKSALMDKIAEVFDKGEHTEIIEDMHYSLYKKELRFNQMLKANIEIFNDKNLFNE